MAFFALHEVEELAVVDFRGNLGAVMARPLRVEFPGASYHITSRGNERRAIFRSDTDRKMFLTFLGDTVKRFGWSLTSYHLMTNHYHLIVTTPEPNLSDGMQWLGTCYAGWFNRRHKRSGHLFGDRFRADLIEDGLYFAEALRYVVLNAVRAKMVALPELYRWSSFCATAGLEPAPEWLDVAAALSYFGGDTPEGRKNYVEFVMIKLHSEESLWDRVINGIYFGSEEWAKKMRKRVESKLRSSDHPLKQRAIGRPKMHEIVTTVAKTAEVTTDDIQNTRGGLLRMLTAWIGWNEGLVTLRTIAASLRLRSEGHVFGLIRRCEREFASNPTLLSQLDQALLALRTV
jgi:putative transposase